MERKRQDTGDGDGARLIDGLRAGDEGCFDAVYRSYFRPLCSYASQYVSSHHAEELVQDTMMWLWENRAAIVPELSLRSLLFTIVRNKSINRISHNRVKHRVHGAMADKFAARFDDPDIYMDNDLADAFSRAIDRLPAEFRAAFLASRVEGLTHNDIAMRLGMSRQIVNYRIGCALRILRDELRDYLPVVFALLSAFFTWPI